MKKLMVWLATASLIALGGCDPALDNAEAIATNALDNAIEVQDDADSRADHLDEAAAGLMADGNRIGGALGNALRSDADADLNEAAAARASGARQARQIEDADAQAIDAAENRAATPRP